MPQFDPFSAMIELLRAAQQVAEDEASMFPAEED